MSKRLEIAGTGKVWILDKCIECPLLDSDACCVIDNKHRPKFDEECENCPLPDKAEEPKAEHEDENSHIAPDGTRVYAVEEPNCELCHYWKDEWGCNNNSNAKCSPEFRKDGRSIIYVTAERKAEPEARK